MPKLVDHGRRRADIVVATCQVIARRGIDATTMREIARELGMANGALIHYFPDKPAILRAVFEHAFDATNVRVDERIGSATGLAALRVFCREVTPADDVTLLEAHVVIPFWQRALHDVGLRSVFEDATAVWRRQITGYLRRARADGEVTSAVADELIVDQLLAMLMGLQIMATLDPGVTTAPRQHDTIDAFLRGLR